MSDPGLTSEQRAAIAVHNATQNRMCLNLSGNGQICVACSEVADQIDAAIAVERQRCQAALAAARREAAKLLASFDAESQAKLTRIYPSLFASAALAAPAAGRDPATEDADAAWRDGEAHGRDE